MFDFMVICNSCGRRDLGSAWGKDTSNCEGCWRLTESVEAKLCEHCANRRGCCKFCKADLNQEFHRLTGGKFRRPTIVQPSQLPRAALAKVRPATPSWPVAATLAVLMAVLFYTGYYFFILCA